MANSWDAQERRRRIRLRHFLEMQLHMELNRQFDTYRPTDQLPSSVLRSNSSSSLSSSAREYEYRALGLTPPPPSYNQAKRVPPPHTSVIQEYEQTVWNALQRMKTQQRPHSSSVSSYASSRRLTSVGTSLPSVRELQNDNDAIVSASAPSDPSVMVTNEMTERQSSQPGSIGEYLS
jgi:hypothetical protein